MAGTCADGVFIRVGTNPKNVKIAVDKIREGAVKVGRDPLSVKIGAVFHTVFVEDPDQALSMARSMAAGYYEYSPKLMENLDMLWGGPHPDLIKEKEGIWPDFHHATDLVSSGKAVNFLTEDQACSADMNGDSGCNVLDVVILVNLILG